MIAGVSVPPGIRINDGLDPCSMCHVWGRALPTEEDDLLCYKRLGLGKVRDTRCFVFRTLIRPRQRPLARACANGQSSAPREPHSVVDTEVVESQGRRLSRTITKTNQHRGCSGETLGPRRISPDPHSQASPRRPVCRSSSAFVFPSGPERGILDPTACWRFGQGLFPRVSFASITARYYLYRRSS